MFKVDSNVWAAFVAAYDAKGAPWPDHMVAVDLEFLRFNFCKEGYDEILRRLDLERRWGRPTEYVGAAIAGTLW